MTAANTCPTETRPLIRIAVPAFRMARPVQQADDKKRKSLTRGELERAFRAELGRERLEDRYTCPDLAALRAALYPQAVRA